jgi:hypothetical protein
MLHFGVRSLDCESRESLTWALLSASRRAHPQGVMSRTSRSTVERSSLSYHFMATQLGLGDNRTEWTAVGLPAQLPQITAAGCVIVGGAVPVLAPAPAVMRSFPRCPLPVRTRGDPCSEANPQQPSKDHYVSESDRVAQKGDVICPRFAGQFVKRHAPSLRTRLG